MRRSSEPSGSSRADGKMLGTEIVGHFDLGH